MEEGKGAGEEWGIEPNIILVRVKKIWEKSTEGGSTHYTRKLYDEI